MEPNFQSNMVDQRGAWRELARTTSEGKPRTFVVHNGSLIASPPITLKEVQATANRNGTQFKIPDDRKPGDPCTKETEILSSTGKMGCWSFSIPAGPPDLGGTCPGAAIDFRMKKATWIDRKGKPHTDKLNDRKIKQVRLDAYEGSEGLAHQGRFICNSCYAIGGSYGMPSGQIKAGILMEWLETILPLPDSDENSFFRVMIEAMEGKFRDSMKEYRKEKISRYEIASPYDLDDYRKAVSAPKASASSVWADPSYGRMTTAERLRIGRRTPKAAAVVFPHEKYFGYINHPNYFRIHDSGDFFSPEYMLTWFRICEYFKDVWFWAPSRVWMLPEYRDILYGKVPKNLALRPSMLYYHEVPDSLNDEKGKRLASVFASAGVMQPDKARDNGVFPCPAYEHGGTCYDSPNPKQSLQRKNVEYDGGCRACWDAPGLPIAYKPHSGAPAAPTAVAKGIKKNGSTGLLKELAAQSARTDAPYDILVNRMMRTVIAEGFSPIDWTMEQWLDAFSALGIEPGDYSNASDAVASWYAISH